MTLPSRLSPRLSRRRLTLAAAVTGAIALGGGLTAVVVQADGNPAAAATAPAVAVEVATVTSQDIVDWQSYSGRLQAVDQVEIRPQVSGPITAVHFKDGSLVRKGDVLFTLDPRPYAAAVEQARAELAAAEAQATYASAMLARSQRLVNDHAISRRDFEEQQRAASEGSAHVLAAKAALLSAQINLGYTRITAPVTGRVSRAEVTVGNVVSPATAQALTTVVSVAQIYASFEVDEATFLKYINPARSGQGAQAPVFLGLANEDGYPRAGRVSSVDNHIDASSGTIRVRATFENRDGLLLPGLYARIRLGGNAPHAAVLIDEKAIGTDQDKRFVLVVDDKNRTAYREVKLGSVHDGLRVIESGLKAGERIVVNGLQRVRPGDAVTPEAAAAPRQVAAH
ncbi:MAG TPA: efflux RND transporter periplasmic adaptor subunit [Moraxellaceae bacterium]